MLNSKLRVLDLFSGIGGFSLGLERTGGFETVAFCEYEPFPRAVLSKHWPDVPCFPDVRKLKGSDIDGPIDVICGGYPCQPFSTAGQRRGKEDDRHLWPEFSRLVAELRPSWVIGENVAGHVSMGLDDVLSDLEGQGYACRTFVIPACAVDAPHRRDRVWTVAHRDGECGAPLRGERPHPSPKSVVGGNERGGSGLNAERQVANGCSGENSGDVAKTSQLQRNGSGEHRQQGGGQVSQSGKRSSAEFVADAERLGQSGSGQPVIASDCATESEGKADHAFAVSKPGKWCVEPDVGRVAHGVSRRVDRLKALGNAVVPQIPEMIGHAILEAEKEKP